MTDRPNILILRGDDIGWYGTSQEPGLFHLDAVIRSVSEAGGGGLR